MSDNYYKKGSWNAVCQRCGFKKKAEEIQKEWTGLLVCRDCYELRHPQDFIKAVPEKQTLPWQAPEPTDTFITVDYVDSTTGTQDAVGNPTGNNNGEL